MKLDWPQRRFMRQKQYFFSAENQTSIPQSVAVTFMIDVSLEV